MRHDPQILTKAELIKQKEYQFMDDAPGLRGSAAEKIRDHERMTKTHLSHCYQGEYKDCCKYGFDGNCPANKKADKGNLVFYRIWDTKKEKYYTAAANKTGMFNIPAHAKAKITGLVKDFKIPVKQRQTWSTQTRYEIHTFELKRIA